MKDLYPPKTKLRNSGIIFSSVCAILFLFIPYLKGEHPNSLILIFIITVILFSIISPSKLRIPYSYWIHFGSLLSKINLTIILTFLFYILITPLSIIRKLCKLTVKSKNNTSSFYKNCEKTPSVNFNEQL